ncbi:MAG: ABC transporter permease [Alphaproteobacteria bacterium]
MTTLTKSQINIGFLLNKYGTFIILIVLLLLAHSMSDVFLTKRNIFNILRQMTGTGLMAVGMLFVILTRGIDLSVGSISALGSVVSAVLVQSLPIPLSLAETLAIGGVCGLISGLLIAYLRLPAFVTTLALMTMARGAALIVSNGQPIRMGSAGSSITKFGSSYSFGIPQPVILLIAVFVIAAIILNFTRFGRMIKAIGSNEEAVRLSGVRVSFYIVCVYVISGILAAAAGIISTSRTGIGSANIGVGAELYAIAAVVIGGASLMGGRGGALNTFFGVFILGIIANLMNLAGVPGFYQQVFMGIIIISAMLLQFSSTLFKR